MTISPTENPREDMREALVARLSAGAPSALLSIAGDAADSIADAAGERVRGLGEPIDPDTPFRIASVTKAVTAVTALRLVEQGRIALDEPVAAYLPADLVQRMHVIGGTSSGHTITLRHLLSHTSGMRDYITDERFTARLLKDPAHRWTGVELVEAALQLGAAEFSPGAGFHYNDTGYVVAGLALEAAAGEPLHLVYRHELFDPLGMDATYLEGHDEPRGGLPATHEFDGQDMTVVSPTFDWSGGGLVSTADDLHRFVRAVFFGNAVQPDSRGQLTRWTRGAQFAAGAAARYDEYGLGVGVKIVDGHQLVGATGSWGAFAFAAPEFSATVVGTLNSFGVDRTPLLQTALRVLEAAHRSSAA